MAFQFEIYSIGESSFLEQIFISIAAISGSGNMASVAAIGGLLGVLFVVIQSIYNGAQSINFQHVLMGLILYMCMFGPTTTILIEDAYTGQVRVVDNVPIAVGISGGIISQVGYGLSVMFDQGFAPIEHGASRRRYMESLEILTELHRNGNDSAIFTSLNNAIGPGADIRRSWNNYIRECTVTKIDLGESSVDEIMNQPIYDALQFNSKIYGTQVFLPAAENLSCTDAFAKLKTNTDLIKDNPTVLNQINQVLGYDPASAAMGATSETPMQRAERALHALQDNTSSAYEFMKVSILEPLYMDAVTGRHMDVHDNTAAIMVNEAIAQRNVQWAAEHSQFMTVARPLMTFFEGFVYAVTPIMAFLIMLGSMGMMLAMKYVQTLIWIQLWMPTLAVINLYLQNAVSTELNSKLGGSNIESMYALNTAADVLSSWIATGGMLAASTPVISLFFVMGSTYALTGLAQRAGGGDHTNEKMMAPDITTSGPLAQFAPEHQGDMVRGLQASGSQSTMSSVSMAAGVDSAVSSASTNMQQASQQFQEQFGRQWGNAWQQGSGFQAATSLTDSLRSTQSDAFKAVEGHVQAFANENGLTSQQTEALKGVVAGNLAAGASTGGSSGSSISGALSGQAASEAASQIGVSASDIAKLTDSAGLSKEQSAALVNDTARAIAETGTQSWGMSSTDTDTGALTMSASEAVSTAETYSKLSSAKESAGASLSTDTFTLGAMIANGPGSAGATAAMRGAWSMAPADARSEAARLEQMYRAPASQGGGGLSPEVARNAAQLTALMNPANYTNGGNYAEGVSSALSVAGAATGRNVGVDTGYGSNAGIGGVSGGVQGRVEAGVNTGGLGLDRSSVGATAQGEPRDVGILNMHHNRAQGVTASGEGFRDRVSADTRNAAIDRILDDNGIKESKAATLFGVEGHLTEQGGAYAMNFMRGVLGHDNLSLQEMSDRMSRKYYSEGMDAGLTTPQASLYAAYGSFDQAEIKNASQALWGEVQHNHADLSHADQEALYQKMHARIEHAAYRGGTAAAAPQLVDISRLNQTNEKLLPASQKPQFVQ